MKRIFVTGASGFVGRALCDQLLTAGHEVWAATRRNEHERNVIHTGSETAFKMVSVGDLFEPAERAHLFKGVDAVVHLAARVHIMREKTSTPLNEYRKANTYASLDLARQAAAAGVRRFVFLSSIKVNGESSLLGRAFTADDVPAPKDAYSISKYEAEQGLRVVAAETGMDVVIIRPPLVYGPGVKANFLDMMVWLYRGIPLPLGAVHNIRSLVALDNLVDLIATCLDHPAAANQTFLAADGDDLSTTELLRRLGSSLGKPARLIPVPEFLLEFGAAILGRRDIARRLCGSLQVDISKARTLLGWNPPVSVDEGLRRTAQGFLHEKTV